MGRSVVVAAGYLLAVTLWIYAAAEPLLWYGSDAAAAVWFSLVALLQVSAGFALGGVGRRSSPSPCLFSRIRPAMRIAGND